MMASILYMLGLAHLPFTSSGQKMERRKLHKEPPAPKTLGSCSEIFDVVRAQSCLTNFSEADDDDDLTHSPELDSADTPTNPATHIGYLLKRQPSVFSEATTSIYSTDEMEQQQLRRTRPKTPVFVIGQLERKSQIHPIDQAHALALQYQAELPDRSVTPCEGSLPKFTPKRLRKIKCQLSLRDVIKTQAERPPSTSYSDTETLVGSDSPSSPNSPAFKHSQLVKITPETHVIDHVDKLDCLPEMNNEVGLKICMDLLTNELASTLSRQHTVESEDRASGLQILLLIEAYETVQRHVRQQIHDLHVTGSNSAHVEAVDEILAHWLRVLYSVYDCSKDSQYKEKAIEDDWPLRTTPVTDFPPPITKGKKFEGSGEDSEDIFVSLC